MIFIIDWYCTQECFVEKAVAKCALLICPDIPVIVTQGSDTLIWEVALCLNQLILLLLHLIVLYATIFYCD